MSTEEVLFRAQATTSLYEEVGGGGGQRLATLSEAKPQYDELVTIDPDHKTTDEAGDAPEIVVQVRKRAGEVELLLDGYVSQGVDVDGTGVRQHNLTWHRGLHEDVETDTAVFSPLAIVAAVEDGQHPFQSVTVSVVQQMARFETPVLSPKILAEAALVPHRVDAPRCSVVRVPYPLAFPPPPTVTMYDNMHQTESNGRHKGKLALLLANAVGQQSIALLWNYLGYQDATLDVASRVTVTVLYAAIGGLANYLGWSFIALASIAQIGLLGNRAPTPGTGEPPQSLIESSDAENPQYQMLSSLAFVVNKAFWTHVNAPPTPGLRRTRFTLDELAAVLESIALARNALTDDDIERIAKSDERTDFWEQHRKEDIVWNWLLDNSKNLPILDTAALEPSGRYTSKLHVRIAVDDSLGCKAEPVYHEIRCKRDDELLLADAGAGALEDLRRLYAAIEALDRALQDGIEKGEAQGKLGMSLRSAKNLLVTFPDRTTFAVTWLTQCVTSAWKTFELKGKKKEMLKTVRDNWAAPSDALLENRKRVLQAAKDNLQKKFVNVLFLPDSPGSALKQRIQTALDAKRCPKPLATHWKRHLPQRAGATFSALFASRPDSNTGRADVEAQGVFVRVHSEYNYANNWMAESMRSSNIALRRFVPEWEASSATRVRLVCVCAPTDGAGALVDRLRPFPAQEACGTLALTTPPDILFSGAVTTPTEHAQRRIRVVVKRAQGDYDKSPLEALGLEHSDASLLACQTFGDLWVEELLALWRLGDSKQAEMLEQASVRASGRLQAAATLLLELMVTRNPTTSLGSGDEPALDRSDPSMLATQAGRDAGALLDRLMFAQNYLAIRVAMVPTIRAVARAGVRAAQAFARAAPVALPHEPVAALFGHPLDGVAAFLRTQQWAADQPEVAQAATAAYPTVRLLESDDATQAAYATAAATTLGVPQLPKRARTTTARELVDAMRFRLASLRMDVAPALGVAGDTSPTSTIDALAATLASVGIEDDASASFYVPFGFGDARPAPTLPPCAAPMFGSVPVYGDALQRAFAMVRDHRSTATSERPLRVLLKPVFGCLLPLANTSDRPEAESVHPNVVQVARNDDGALVVRFAASSVPERGARAAADEPTTAAKAAKAHERSEATTRTAAEVASVAWNAERVVQAVVAALASADGADFDAIEVSLALPPDDRGSSPWYKRPHNPMALAEKRRKKTRFVDIDALLLAMLFKHYALSVDALIDALQVEVKDERVFAGAPNFDAYKTKRDAMGSWKKDLAAGSPKWNELVDATQVTLAALLTDGVINELVDKAIEQEIAALDNDYLFTADYEDSLNYLVILEKARLESNENRGPRKDARKAERDSLAQQATDIGRVQGRLKEQLELQQATDAEYADFRRVLEVPDPDAAPPDPENARQHKVLVGALGLGMAMLIPLVDGAAPLRCSRITEPTPPIRGTWDASAALAEAFGEGGALRLSEACLVVRSLV
jgi:hypothetical protein